MGDNKKKGMRYVPNDAILGKDERGWVPLSQAERNERHWSLEDAWKRVESGEMKFAYASANTVVFFEKLRDRNRIREDPWSAQWEWKYGKQERFLAEKAGIPYWYDVQREEELLRQEEAKRKEESSFENVLSGFFSVIGAVLGFIFQVIAVICCIFLVRNATQWFLGTGKYARKDD